MPDTEYKILLLQKQKNHLLSCLNLLTCWESQFNCAVLSENKLGIDTQFFLQELQNAPEVIKATVIYTF